MSEEIDFMNRNSALEQIVIGSTGSIASGKSSFLSALHAVLAYDERGIKIDKDILPRGGGGIGRREADSKAYEKREKGLFRTNATDRPDSMFVYGVKDNKIYPFNFLAPGGHVNAIKIESKIDGLLYFIDLRLVDFVGNLGARGIYKLGDKYRELIAEDGDVTRAIKKDIKQIIRYNNQSSEDEVFGLIKRDAGAPENCNTVDELASFLEKSYKNIPQFGLPVKKGDGYVPRQAFQLYKRELLGEVVQSIIDSHTYALSQFGNGAPVVGVGTHKDKVYGKLPKDEENLLRAVQDNFNKAISKFIEYQRLNGIQAEDFTLDLMNSTPIQWFFVGLYKQIKRHGRFVGDYFDDILNPKNVAVLEIAYNIMAKALQYKDIEPDGFKIVTFSKAQSDLTIHYDKIALPKFL